VPSELRNACRFFALIAVKRLIQIKNTFLNSRLSKEHDKNIAAKSMNFKYSNKEIEYLIAMR